METEENPGASATSTPSESPSASDESVLDPFAGLSFSDYGRDGEARKLLQIRARGTDVDELALVAREKIVKKRYEGKADEVADVIDRNGLSATIEKVTKRLSRAALSEQERFLLANEDIYGAMLLEAFEELSATPSDSDAGRRTRSGAGAKKREADA
jgi:hypothetical protein